MNKIIRDLKPGDKFVFNKEIYTVQRRWRGNEKPLTAIHDASNEVHNFENDRQKIVDFFPIEKQQFRKKIAKELKKYRKQNNLTAYRVARDGGIRISQIKIIDEGTTNYTIDILIGYMIGCGLNINFSNKDET